MSTPTQILDAAIEARVLVVSDSQPVYAARQLIEQGNLATGAVLFDFCAGVPSAGLRDLDAILNRIAQVDLTEFDAVLVNFGAADLLHEDNQWNGFFAGTAPSQADNSQMSYAGRIEAVVDALYPLPVVWIGVPTGMQNNQYSQPFHPWEVAAIDIALDGHGGRLIYVHPDDALGSYSPRFSDGIHYSPGAASLVFAAAVAAILAAV